MDFDRDGWETTIKVGPNWIPLATYKEMKERRREYVKGACFIIIIVFIGILLLFGTP